MKRSYYQDSIFNFLEENTNAIFGQLAKQHQHDLEDKQKNAWIWQIEFLKSSLSNTPGTIYFEFSIPRMGKRVDTVLIIKNIIFVVEFKTGETNYSREAQRQVIDYCLDLRNFHEASHDKIIIPILIVTRGDIEKNDIKNVVDLNQCIICNSDTFKSNLVNILEVYSEAKEIDVFDWENSIYKPTPTIIEAAQALYKGHDVEEISRNDAGAINLSRTASAINAIIESAKVIKQKSICFITGVPGAGKTLAGLSIANQRLKADESEHAVFLSGNGPLVDVLREALARDSVNTARANGKK